MKVWNNILQFIWTTSEPYHRQHFFAFEICNRQFAVSLGTWTARDLKRNQLEYHSWIVFQSTYSQLAVEQNRNILMVSTHFVVDWKKMEYRIYTITLFHIIVVTAQFANRFFTEMFKWRRCCFNQPNFARHESPYPLIRYLICTPGRQSRKLLIARFSV